jgi:hypothetical protein
LSCSRQKSKTGTSVVVNRHVAFNDMDASVGTGVKCGIGNSSAQGKIGGRLFP